MKFLCKNVIVRSEWPFFSDPNLSQNWQFSCNKLLFKFIFKLNFIPVFSTKIPSEEPRMSESLLEENPLIP